MRLARCGQVPKGLVRERIAVVLIAYVATDDTVERQAGKVLSTGHRKCTHEESRRLYGKVRGTVQLHCNFYSSTVGKLVSALRQDSLLG